LRSKNSITVTLTAVFAAVYAVGVVFLAPISFQIFQVRVADALLPLSMLFGWPAVLGLTIGAFVANFYGGLGPVDMIGGSLANFLATFAAWKIVQTQGRAWRLAGVALEVAVISLIVGPYLSFLLAMPLGLGIVGVLLGSVVAIGILGSILLFALSRGRMLAMLRSYGMTTTGQEKTNRAALHPD
jgi:uncharacterized membrane protein